MKYSNALIDEAIINRNIKRLDEYQGSKTSISWQCLLPNCGSVWKTRPSRIILKNHGCKKCYYNSLKLNIKDVEIKLMSKNIKILDDYINSQTPTQFQCLKTECNYIWKTNPNAILNRNTGCPKCSKRAPVNNDNLDKILIIKDIKRLDDVKNGYEVINFECLKENCRHRWKTSPNSVINLKSGCPKCAGNLIYTNEKIDNILYVKNIKRISDYINMNSKITLQCLEAHCNYIWTTTASSIKTSGCPKCVGLVKFTNEDMDSKILNRNIKRLDDYINSKTKIEWQCLKNECRYKWKTTPTHIIDGTGCPACNFPGINQKLIFNILVQNNIEFEHECVLNKVNSKEKRRLKFDFYFPKIKMAIEYDGKQHFSAAASKFANMSIEEAEKQFKLTQERDQYKNQFCIKNAIKLIRIDGRKYYGKKLIELINLYVVNELKKTNE